VVTRASARVGSPTNTFVIESFIDELAAAAKQDPSSTGAAAGEAARARGFCSSWRQHAGWGAPLPAGRGARHRAHVQRWQTYLAQWPSWRLGVG